jgi:PAS domain S-box-containing protein
MKTNDNETNDPEQTNLRAENAALQQQVEQLQAALQATQQQMEELRHREQRSRIIADFTADWQYWVGPDGTFLYVSPSCEYITGYAPDAFQQHRDLLEHILHPQDRNHFLEQMKCNFTSSERCETEFRIMTRQGQERWIGHICQPVYAPDGQFLGRRVSNRDITERKQIEEELQHTREKLEAHVRERTTELAQANEQLHIQIAEREQAEAALLRSEARYREITELISDSVYSVWLDEEGNLALDWGFNGLERLTGYTLEELPLQEWESIVHPADREISQRRMQTFFHGQPVESEYRVITKSGEVRWLRDHGWPVLDEASGRLVRIYGAVKDVTIYKQASQSLREREAIYRAMFEESQAVQWLVDPTTGAIVDANASACQFYGYPREVLCSLKVQDINVLPAERVQQNMQQVLKSESRHFCFQHRLATGDIRDVEVYSSPIEVQGRRLVYSIIHDITDRKRAEEALRESESHLRTLLSALPDMVFRIDPDGVFVDFQNPRGDTLFSSPEKMLGQPYHMVMAAGPREQLTATIERARQSGAVERFEYSSVLANGQQEDYEVRVVVGADMHAFCIVRNITETKQIETRIRQHAARTEALVHVAARLNVQLDLQAVLRSVCEEATKALAVDIVLVCLYDQHHESLRPVYRLGGTSEFASVLQHVFQGYIQELSQTVATIQVIDDVQARDDVADANGILQATNARTLVGANIVREGELVGILHVMTVDKIWELTDDGLMLLRGIADQAAQAITNARLFATVQEERTLLAQRVDERTAELSRANAELARAVRTKDEFLANMSHELRTPLNAILGLTESLQEYVYGPLNERQSKTLHTIETSGRHLLDLINDILDLAKIEAGKMELNLDTVTISMVCQSSLQFIKQQAKKKHINVTFAPQEESGNIQADVRRLKQILVNLLSNAVKFTPDGGEIGLDVAIEHEQERVVFAVWDNGRGIAREQMGRLFKPFVQLDSSLSREYVGTGLGLALVARLTEMHGGSVSVESEVGKGSRFTVALPLQRGGVQAEETGGDVASSVQQATSSAAAHLASGPLILLAEDNESNIDLYSVYLQSKGYRVVVARNGEEAIARFYEEWPEIILMDIQMPRLNGLEAMRRIRAEEQPQQHIPIIALTALAMPDDRQTCLEAGADDYLSKPVGLKQLLRAIENQLL